MVKINILDLVFPKKCLGCGKEGCYLCPGCILKNSRPRPICPYCLRAAIDGMTHTRCQRKLGLDALVSLWPYEGVFRRAILSLKYKFAKEIAAELALAAVNEIKKSKYAFPKNPTLVPVPIYWYKENMRGFNQSAEIAGLLAKEIGWKFLPDLLSKKGSTLPQAGLKRQVRLLNLRGTFKVNSRSKLATSHQPLILFDDVWTTGATLKEAAMALKRKGAKSVWGLTLMRD